MYPKSFVRCCVAAILVLLMLSGCAQLDAYFPGGKDAFKGWAVDKGSQIALSPAVVDKIGGWAAQVWLKQYRVVFPLSSERQLDRFVLQRLEQLDDTRFEQGQQEAMLKPARLLCEDAIVARHSASEHRHLHHAMASTADQRVEHFSLYVPAEIPAPDNISHSGAVRQPFTNFVRPHDATNAHQHPINYHRLKKHVPCPHVRAVLRDTCSD